MMNKKLLEALLLFILLINIFRSQYIVNQLIMALVFIPLLLFILSSLPSSLSRRIPAWVRPLCLGLIVITLYGFVLQKHILYRISHGDYTRVHDGAVQTEMATRALLEGKNPYSISYTEVFGGERFYPEGRPHPILDHYMYSPMTFVLNVPFYLTENVLFGEALDIRITFIVFLFLTSLIGAFVVKERLLFLILFFLNPLFVHTFFLGANDVLILFFIFSAIAFLALGRTTLATVFVALGVGTKLTIAPFVPLYFLYLFVLFQGRKDRTRRIFRELSIFLGVTALVYLPFIVWNAQALVEDLLLFPLAGGGQGYPITGILGLPHLMVSLGLVSSWTSFPFYLIQIPIMIALLFLMYSILRKSPKLPVLALLYVVFFILSFSLSRIFQPNYLDFISQVLVLAVFLKA